MKTKYLDKKKWRRLVRSKYDEIILTYQNEKNDDHQKQETRSVIKMKKFWQV